jgi:hypothetical protein
MADEEDTAIRLPDLTPIAAEEGAGPGDDPRQSHTSAGLAGRSSFFSFVRSYIPSDGGAPRLVSNFYGSCLGVWDSRDGAFLQALEDSHYHQVFRSLVTFQRPSDGSPRCVPPSLALSHIILAAIHVKLS